MDEVVCGIDTLDGRRQRSRAKHVTGDQLHGLADPRAEVLWFVGEELQANPPSLKQRQ